MDFNPFYSLKGFYCTLARPIVEYGSILRDLIHPLTLTNLNVLSVSSLISLLSVLKQNTNHTITLHPMPLKTQQSIRLKSIRKPKFPQTLNSSIDAPELLTEVNFRILNRSSRLSASYIMYTMRFLDMTQIIAESRNHPIHRMM